MKQLFIFFPLIFLVLNSCKKNDSNPVDSNSSNYSLKFNGVNTYVEISFTEKHDLFQDFSIESWVKFDSVAVGTVVTKVIQVDSVDISSSYSIYFDKQYPNKVIFSTLVGAHNDPDFEHKAISSIELSPKQWHHIAVIYTESDYGKKIFIDGILAYDEINTGNIGFNGRPLYFGALKTISGEIMSPFEGNIDEVRIWQKAFSQEEISYNKNHQLSGNENGLVGLYHFNEGTGSIATDNSTTKVNGIIKGAVWDNSY
jgi:hypothetical protein